MSAVHLSLAYILIFQPALFESQALVRVVGGAMQLVSWGKTFIRGNPMVKSFFAIT